MYMPVHVTGVDVSVLVDTGASRSFVSAKFTAMTKLHVKREVPRAVQLPTGGSETTDHVLHCEFLIENIIYA